MLIGGLAVASAPAPSVAQPLPSGPVAGQADPATPARAANAPRKQRAGTKPTMAKRNAPAKTADKAPEPWRVVDPGRAAQPASGGPLPTEPKSVVSHYGTNEPLEIGGKWSGSNDTAEKTRVENYNGAAAGTGGEVGLKLHF